MDEPHLENLIKRAYLYIEDGKMDSASAYLDKVLDVDAEYAPAYIAKVVMALGLSKEEELGTCLKEYSQNPDWVKAMRFASPTQQKTYEHYLAEAEKKKKKSVKVKYINKPCKSFNQPNLSKKLKKQRHCSYA